MRELLIVLFTTIMLSACSGIVPRRSEPSTQTYSLVGTKWIGGDKSISVELTFTETDFNLLMVRPGERGTTFGSYRYVHPDVFFVITGATYNGESRAYGGTFFGKVEGETMGVDINNDGSCSYLIKNR